MSLHVFPSFTDGKLTRLIAQLLKTGVLSEGLSDKVQGHAARPSEGFPYARDNLGPLLTLAVQAKTRIGDQVQEVGTEVVEVYNTNNIGSGVARSHAPCRAGTSFGSRPPMSWTRSRHYPGGVTVHRSGQQAPGQNSYSTVTDFARFLG
jgi:hypothetical protein